MTGILESLLTRLYGKPNVVHSKPFIEYRWNEADEPRHCTLYKPLQWDVELERRFGQVKVIYGDAVGASILCGGLNVSMLRGPRIFGLYPMEEFQRHPNVLRALDYEPGICFFMNTANVCYYGAKDGQLYVYDIEDPDRVDVLGDIESEFELLIREWEAAAPTEL